MFEKLGDIALAIMVGAESFVVSAAFLWPASLMMHLGPLFQKGAFAISGVLGVIAAITILWLAGRPKSDI
jgi:hypothetical protein